MRVPLVTPAMRAATTEALMHTPLLIPTHYLSADTLTAPFVLLTEGYGSPEALSLPVAVGVWPSPRLAHLTCGEGPNCMSRDAGDEHPLLWEVEDSASNGGRQAWCMPCLAAQEPVAPAHAVEWVEA